MEFAGTDHFGVALSVSANLRQGAAGAGSGGEQERAPCFAAIEHPRARTGAPRCFNPRKSSRRGDGRRVAGYLFAATGHPFYWNRHQFFLPSATRFAASRCALAVDDGVFAGTGICFC